MTAPRAASFEMASRCRGNSDCGILVNGTVRLGAFDLPSHYRELIFVSAASLPVPQIKVCPSWSVITLYPAKSERLTRAAHFRSHRRPDEICAFAGANDL